MRDYDPRRFGSYADKPWQVLKAKEDYCLRHEIPYPHFNRLAGRPVKPSPLHEALKASGAVFEEVYGHERARWFAKNGVAQHDHYSFRRTVVNDLVNDEVAAVRQSVGIMDITAFTKVEVSGNDALSFLDPLVANRLPSRTGGIALTHLLTEHGRIELEATVVRFSDTRFYLVCAAFFEQRLIDYLQAHNPPPQVSVINRSDTWGALAINGPRSRDVLSQCTDSPLSNEAFKWLSGQQIKVAGYDCWALRLSYAGELGWELHAPAEKLLGIYNALYAAGKSYAITLYGSFAMNVMRMEKMFKGAGELTNEVTLAEADVMRFVQLDKTFVGDDATRASAASDKPWVCAYLAIDADGEHDGHGGEAVLFEGDVVGSTASIVYSQTVDKILAFAYIKPHAAIHGTKLSVIIAGSPRAAVVLAEAVYDPSSALPRTNG